MARDLKREVRLKIQETYAKANELFNCKFPIPKVQFSLVLNELAGEAHQLPNLIKINLNLLRANPDFIVNNTTIHECAHLIAWQYFPDFNDHHGPQWRYVMRRFGLEPDVYHNLE